MKKKYTRATVAVAAAAALMLTACSPSEEPGGDGDSPIASTFDELVAAAKEEGTLTIYSADTEEHLLAVIEAFEAEYGIKVEYVRLASAAVEQRFAEERQAGVIVADVIQQADPTFFDIYSDWFIPLSEVPLPSLDAYDPAYVSTYSASGVIFPSGLQYNTDLVSPDEVPTSYEELLDPKWKGKILFITPTASPTPLSLLNLIGETYGEEWISKFGEQDLSFVDSASPGAQQIAAGAFAINFPTAGGAQTAPVKASGAPIDFVVFEPVQVGTNELSLPKGSPNPNAGALFLNFRTSQAGWKAVCDTNPQYGTPFDTPLPGCIEVPGSNPVKVNYEVWHDEARKNNILDLLGF